MNLGLSKIIPPEQRIKPEIKEESRKIALPKDKAPRIQIILIARNDEVDVASFQVRKCPDDAIWRDDRNILEHEGFQSGFVEEMGIEGFGRIHDQGVRVKVEEIRRMRVRGHSMADGWDCCPGARGIV